MNTPPKFIATVESVQLRREQWDFQCKCLREFAQAVQKIESSEVLWNTHIEWYLGQNKSLLHFHKRQIELELERQELEQWEQKLGLR